MSEDFQMIFDSEHKQIITSFCQYRYSPLKTLALSFSYSVVLIQRYASCARYVYVSLYNHAGNKQH